jgi:hypothetical protein
MYWRREYLRKAASLPVGGTWREDLPDHGRLGSILLHVSGAAVTDSMVAIKKWRLIDWISSVEVVGNGSEIITSLPASVLKYAAFLDNGIALTDKEFNYGSSTRRSHLLLNFGRALFDGGMGLDLDKWDSVELKVSNDAAAAQFASALAVDALMYLLEDPLEAWPGYLRKEEWRKWTTVQNETQYLELPTQYPIRRIILQVIPDDGATYVEATTTPYNVAYNIELNLKTGTIRVWNGNLRDLWYENAFDRGRDIIQALESYHTDAYGIWTGLGQTLGIGAARTPHDSTQDTASPSFEPGDDSSTLRRLTNTDSDVDSMLVAGLALENCAVFRFDHLPDFARWLDPRAMDTVQLNIATRDASTAAGGTIRVILDRFVAK